MLARQGHQMAVTSNGSEKAVHRFLEKNNVTVFGEHVYARVAHKIFLKPDSDCIHRAITRTGVSRSECLMIGDSWSDVEAAKRAEVDFLGIAVTPAKEKELVDVGAKIIHSWSEVLR